MLKQTGAVLSLLLLCGCLQTKDDLTINADGSGKVHMEIVSGIPSELAESMEAMGGERTVIFPPISEAEARKFFVGKDFNVTTKQQRADNGDVTTVIDVDFKDINALLASPYGHAHQLSAQVENGTLVIKGITGLEGSARFAEMKGDGDMAFGMMGNLGNLQKRKNEMRVDFRITLPNTVTGGNGANAGKTAAWSVARAQCKDADDFADKLGTVCEARCATDGVKFSPTTPVRLALYPFAQLANGATVASTSTVDTNKVAAAVKFVPYGLTVTRSLDLSGNGSARENAAQLIGALVVPSEYTPEKWGSAKLEEVVDAKGNDLKPKDRDEMESFSIRSEFSRMDGENEDATNKVVEQRHIVSLAFRPPDWKVNEIAKIKGSTSLQYFGGSQTVVKLTNAIPAKWIMDVSKGGFESFDGSERTLGSPALTELGLAISSSSCMSQGGFTILSLQVKGTGAMLADAQVFDSSGKPWPTTLTEQSIGEQNSVQIAVAGRPQAPLSLALLVSGAGAVVEVPILMEHVMITEKATKE